jgi:hypothetical protein
VNLQLFGTEKGISLANEFLMKWDNGSAGNREAYSH